MQIKTRNRWKRVGVSFVSAVSAELAVGLAVCSIDGSHLFFEHMFGFLFFASVLAFPGWLIALPIILQAKFDDLSLWQQVLIGTLIGPTIMIAIGIYGGVASGTFDYSAKAFHLLYVAVGVSFLASAIYVTALNFASPKDCVQKPT
jgi:hypothetical protein